MSPNSLQIKQLSKSGEVLKTISCPAGRISVLRGFTPSDLKPYQRAFTGVPGPERITISVDGSTYDQNQHCLIGFGEQLPGHQTVRDWLSTKIPPGGLDSILLSYGLESTTGKQMAQLPIDEERRLQLLMASYESDSVLVLNNPLEPISSNWRERFAELLAKHVVQTRRIVVITSLIYRPECWINNDVINRVQVGEDIQKTIGFGGAAGGSQLIKDVRAMLKEGADVQDVLDHAHTEARRSPATPAQKTGSRAEAPEEAETVVFSAGDRSRSKKTRHRSQSSRSGSKKKQGLFSSTRGILAGLVVLLLLVLNFSEFSDTTPDSEQSRSASTAPESKPITVTVAAEKSETRPELDAKPKTDRLAELKKALEAKSRQARQDGLRPENNSSAGSGSVFVLDLYPPQVKRAVMTGFESVASVSTGLGSPPVQEPVRTSPRVEKKDPQAEGLLKALQDASGTGKGLPDQKVSTRSSRSASSTSSSSVSSLSPEEREKRRELIRQKFLEAIARASKK